MWFLLCLLPLRAVLGADSVCGPMPDSFVDPFGASLDVHYSDYNELSLGVKYFPYRAFDKSAPVVAVAWHLPGTVRFLSASHVYVHIANTDWQHLANLTGTIYTKLTETDSDLQKINSYICDDFTAMKAMVVTFDCLRQDDASDTPKVRYQLILAYGKESNGEEKNFLLILVDILPGDAWDYLSTAKYKYYLSDDTDYYPLSVTEHSVMSFDVTHKQAFTPDVEPDNNGPPCPPPSVCGPMPDSFVDPFDASFDVHYSDYNELSLGVEYFPYRAFDKSAPIVAVAWHLPGTVRFLSASHVYVHIANTDWQHLANLTGTIYTKLTETDSDLQKINSYICDDFTAMKAMVVTFDCLRQDNASDTPKVRYQLILAYGKESNGEEKNFLLILVDILPGDAWDYLSTAKYKYYLSDDTDYYPLSVTEHSVMSFDVTHKQAFTPDVEPNNNIPPC